MVLSMRNCVSFSSVIAGIWYVRCFRMISNYILLTILLLDADKTEDLSSETVFKPISVSDDSTLSPLYSFVTHGILHL